MSARWAGPPPAEICVVMLSAIGDAIHVLPVVSALKRAWPTSRVTWIIQPVPHKLLAGHPAVDDFIVFERRRGPSAVRSYLDLSAHLRGRRFDLAIGLQVYFKAGLILGMVPATVKLGFDRARARDAQWLFSNRRIDPHPPQHVQDQYFEFLRYLGIEPEPVEWGLSLNDGERAAQRRFFANLDAPACGIVLGTSKVEKNWTAEGYARVAEAAASRHGLTPVLLGGPSPIERALADAVSAEARVAVVDALGDDLRRLAWLIDGCAVVVSPDTGPLHLSRALGTPVVGLYGYTNPKRYGPYRAFGELVVDGYAEYPGEAYPATHVYRDGMKRVTVADVLEKLSLAVSEYVIPNRKAETEST